ncbi:MULTISPECIES: RIP metalloprotease RseP [unclassified Janthinobacterium]|uniref:RIP metalloprotease RseP n=1 Tax=unclassified Janthinobacterium TaxID=2610881 RepID=UPI00161FC229|nr:MULTISPECIES: RIP metalloprotease RseP [unclassified Janthinobacterium]MBB5609981.1 regulator of sigma E protease [Janthinobacterium sp. S3T4]MBB5614999.1 regulator of sigma E protease [Janthinobacterium sp. S3M3]
MTLITTLLAFIVALGSLITLHELGHYLVARWCGVKVLRFSIGMGKVVYSRRFGKDQTEWAISALPLGGYVKMLDSREQDLSGLPEAELRREFTRQSVWRRIAIVAAGPLANFLVAIVLYAGLFMHGIEEPSSKLGPVAAPSAAYAAGLRGGDTVTSVNGKAVASWSELRWELIQATLDKRVAQIEVQRPERGLQEATLPAGSLTESDLEGDAMGKLGLVLARPAPVLGKIMPGGAAARAGLLPGDLVLAIDGQPMADGIAVIETLRASPGKTLEVLLRRHGQELTLAVTPDSEKGTGTEAAVTVGKIKAEVALAPDMIVMASGPFAAVAKASRKVWDTSAMSVKMLGKMITGQVSLKNVTGPITIADYAGQTARIGLMSYLSFIAFISISLGVMNLLPIPVLDGGHLLYYSLEVLTGRPLPERVADIAQRLGIGLLLTLMVLAVFNDVLRLLN